MKITITEYNKGIKIQKYILFNRLSKNRADIEFGKLCIKYKAVPEIDVFAKDYKVHSTSNGRINFYDDSMILKTRIQIER